MKVGICSSKEDPVIIREMAATAHIDGKNCLGPVVGDYAMAVACRKARESGVGWVVAKGTCNINVNCVMPYFNFILIFALALASEPKQVS